MMVLTWRDALRVSGRHTPFFLRLASCLWLWLLAGQDEVESWQVDIELERQITIVAPMCHQS